MPPVETGQGRPGEAIKDMASRHSRRGGAQSVRTRVRTQKAKRQRFPEALSADPGTIDDVMRCARELARPVGPLRRMYPPTLVVLAMLAQTAATLRSLLQSGRLSQREAVRYCREFGAYVLARRASANRSGRRTPTR